MSRQRASCMQVSSSPAHVASGTSLQSAGDEGSGGDGGGGDGAASTRQSFCHERSSPAVPKTSTSSGAPFPCMLLSKRVCTADW
jgi:hypothetical protein